MRKYRILIATFVIMLVPALGNAQGTLQLENVDSSHEYAAAILKLRNSLPEVYSGDTEIDFARSMIALHQASIDTAAAMIKYGQTEELKELAASVIRTQSAELVTLREWLAKDGLPKLATRPK